MKTDENKLKIQKSNSELTFDLKNENGKFLYYLEIKSDEEANEVESEETDENKPNKNLIKKLDINVAHGYCHSCEGVLRKNYKNMGIELVGELKACDGCNQAKGKAKNVNKSTDKVAKEVGERVLVDASGPFEVSKGGSRYWFQAVDEFSRYGWCGFGKNKTEIGEFYDGVCKYLQGCGYKLKYLRCDNAGENVKHLKEVAEKYGIEIEYTAPHTPQFNEIVERRFPVLLEKAKAMLISANFTPGSKKILWAEAVNTVHFLYILYFYFLS